MAENRSTAFLYVINKVYSNKFYNVFNPSNYSFLNTKLTFTSFFLSKQQ